LTLQFEAFGGALSDLVIVTLLISTQIWKHKQFLVKTPLGMGTNFVNYTCIIVNSGNIFDLGEHSY
jgi:hypothetical protein